MSTRGNRIISRLEGLERDARERGAEHFAAVGPRPSGCLSGEWAGESITELLGDLFEEAESLDDAESSDDAEAVICDAFEAGFEDAESATPTPKERDRTHTHLTQTKGDPMLTQTTWEEAQAEKRRLADLAGFYPGPVSPDEKTLQILAAWRGGRPRHGRLPSLWTDGVTVWSYGTAILQHAGDGSILFNSTRYSTTTSRRQNYCAMLGREYTMCEGEGDEPRRWIPRATTASGERFCHVYDVPRGCKDLAEYHERQHTHQEDTP